jgi:hypothetical protein
MPERIEARDESLLDVAPHKLSLTGGQDAATSPLRASLAEYQDKANPKSSVDEKPRGGGLQRSTGGLQTCRFCLGMWVASLFTYGLVVAPHVTRLTATLFVVVATSIAYTRLAQPS